MKEQWVSFCAPPPELQKRRKRWQGTGVDNESFCVTLVHLWLDFVLCLMFMMECLVAKARTRLRQPPCQTKILSEFRLIIVHFSRHVKLWNLFLCFKSQAVQLQTSQPNSLSSALSLQHPAISFSTNAGAKNTSTIKESPDFNRKPAHH